MSVGQVLAATGASTLGAVLVKLLDIWGTVLGTAVLSVCTSIGAVLILRTMRRTSEKVKEQITVLSRASETRIQHGATVDLSAETVRLETVEEIEPAETDSGGPHSRKRTLLAILVSSVAVFALTMGALFLFGTIAHGDPTKYIVQESTTTVYVGDDQGDADQSPRESASEDESETPTDEATADEETEDPSTEEPTEETPTEEATTEEPTESAADDGVGATESPSAESQEATEAPTE